MEDKHIVRKRKDRKMGTKKPEWGKAQKIFLLHLCPLSDFPALVLSGIF